MAAETLLLLPLVLCLPFLVFVAFADAAAAAVDDDDDDEEEARCCCGWGCCASTVKWN